MAALLSLCLIFPSAAAESTDAIIESIRLEGAEAVISVQVPAGITRVTLESRTRISSGAWVPRAVQRVSGDGGQITF
ncbi:MAG: hypothetical protein AB1813_21270, partial [Verrucomicrobiota bacterium]